MFAFARLAARGPVPARGKVPFGRASAVGSRPLGGPLAAAGLVAMPILAPAVVTAGSPTCSQLPHIEIVACDAKKRRFILWSVYDIGGPKFVTPLLSQIWYGLRSLVCSPYSVLFVYRTACEPSCDAARTRLARFMTSVGSEIVVSTPQAKPRGGWTGDLMGSLVLRTRGRRGWLAAWLLAPTLALAQPAAQHAGPGSSEYLIGPGDTLQVFVWRNPDLSVTVPVRPDGRISTPLVEDMPAVGKTPTQLARDIEKALSQYVRSPQVNIIVTQSASALSQVKVIGQVAKPAPVPYREGMTVIDAVLAVGGLTNFAAGNRARLVRMQDGKEVEIRVRLDALMNDGDMSQNLKLRPGDVLVVPESRF